MYGGVGCSVLGCGSSICPVNRDEGKRKRMRLSPPVEATGGTNTSFWDIHNEERANRHTSSAVGRCGGDG